jgi:hypothetical protein
MYESGTEMRSVSLNEDGSIGRSRSPLSSGLRKLTPIDISRFMSDPTG